MKNYYTRILEPERHQETDSEDEDERKRYKQFMGEYDERQDVQAQEISLGVFRDEGEDWGR
jgi:hypothetical protein